MRKIFIICLIFLSYPSYSQELGGIVLGVTGQPQSKEATIAEIRGFIETTKGFDGRTIELTFEPFGDAIKNSNITQSQFQNLVNEIENKFNIKFTKYLHKSKDENAFQLFYENDSTMFEMDVLIYKYIKPNTRIKLTITRKNPSHFYENRSIVSSQKNVDVKTAEYQVQDFRNSVYRFGKQFRTGAIIQGVGIGSMFLGSLIIGLDPNNDSTINPVGGFLIVAGGVTSVVGTIVFWSAGRHLRITSNGLNLIVEF